MRNKILILGANPETAALVEKAKEKGLTTFVIGKEKNNITKKIADFSIIGDATNMKLVNDLIKKNNIDAVMVGVVDVLINTYEKICRKFKFPCYANIKSVKAFSSKNKFNKICKKFGLNIIPDYTNYYKQNKKIPLGALPVIVKPTDSGGGVGATLCRSNKEVEFAVNKAKSVSKSNNFICQKYFLEDDIQIYYTILKGKVYLSSVSDRSTTKIQKKNAPVCIGANYNSKYLNLILKKYNDKFKNMINYLGIKNGILSIQCFVKNNEIYPYDPGFRLQGEGNHIVLSKLNKFDHLDMMLDLSLGKPFFNRNFRKLNDPKMKEKFVSSVWILLRAGIIKKIKNLDRIKKHKCCIGIMQRFNNGDRIKSSFIGTEKQVFARIYLSSKNKNQLTKSIKYIHANLKILDKNNNSLILDHYVRNN